AGFAGLLQFGLDCPLATILGREDDAAVLADELLLLIAEQLPHAEVPGVDDTAAIECEYRVLADRAEKWRPRHRTGGRFVAAHVATVRARADVGRMTRYLVSRPSTASNLATSSELPDFSLQTLGQLAVVLCPGQLRACCQCR